MDSTSHPGPSFARVDAQGTQSMVQVGDPELVGLELWLVLPRQGTGQKAAFLIRPADQNQRIIGQVHDNHEIRAGDVILAGQERFRLESPPPA